MNTGGITLEHKGKIPSNASFGNLNRISSSASFGNLSEMSAQSAAEMDERSGDQIHAHVEKTLGSSHADFIAAVLAGATAVSSVALTGLGDVSEDVREAGISVARAALSGDASKGKEAELLAALAAAVDADVAKGEAPMNRQEDHIRGGIIALYGHCAAGLPAGDAGREPALQRILQALHVVGDHGAYVAAPALAKLAHDLGANDAATVSKLVAEALKGATAVERRAGAAGVAGIVNGMGGAAIGKFGIVAAITESLAAKKDAVARAGGCALYTHMCRTAGRSFEPFAIGLAATVFILQGDQSSDVRHAADAAQAAVVSSLPLTAMKLLAPALAAAMMSKSWQPKVGALGICGDLAQRVPSYFMRTLPEIFPAFLECVFDTHPKVSAIAGHVMVPIASCVKNPEVIGMLDLIIDAIRNPQLKTEPCLDKLMETTFVNSMDAPSLAVVLPVIMRGLRERAMDIKKKAAVTCGNICALVDDVRDLNPFIPSLKPELEKCEEHSHPDLRECATKAKAGLMKGVDAQAGVERKIASQCVQVALKAHGAAALDHETAAYAASLGGWVIDMAPLRIPPAILANDVKRELMSVLEGQMSDTDCAVAAETAVLDYKGLDAEALNNLDQADFIVDLQGIILAFAGRVLLQRTNFSLERGHTYGIVGQNGTGKTTLLNRVAAKDIAGFPADVSIYYILHEILSEKEETIVDFMVQMVPAGVTRETVVSTLREVGFDDVKMAATIQSLSGGWRMKLAIARAMLWDAEVLLLDEPTNHLDTAAIAWLVSYLRSLTKTTICLVSHDYDFLAEVLTDVIHLSDKTLTYYPMGFRDFQALKPEIVAALPSPDNAIKKQATIEKDKEKVPGGAMKKIPSMARVASVSGMSTVSSIGDEEEEEEEEVAKPMNAIDAVAAGGEAAAHIKPIRFPDPGPLDGVKSRQKVIMYMKDVSFKYPGTDKCILTAANVKITQGSRAALVGLNGAGKTTLMKILIGELQADSEVGEVWQHHNLRLAYIAQHSMHHLEESIENTPLEYLQNRFYLGRDKEISKRSSHNLTKEELAIANERGQIAEVVGRQERGKHLFYEIRRSGRKESDTDWEMMSALERKDAYVMKMVRNFDEKMKSMQSGMDLRPLTKEEVRLHLAEFGIDEDLAMGKIKRMSGGQKSRLVLAAAMWINPHIIALDEPTNYLDNDTLAALTKALSDFKGGVLTISHNKAFVNELCTETWTVGDGVVIAEAIEGKGKKVSVAERRAQKMGNDSYDDLTEVKENKKQTAAERKAEAERKAKNKGPQRGDGKK